jgi:hypothetical protein
MSSWTVSLLGKTLYIQWLGFQEIELEFDCKLLILTVTDENHDAAQQAGGLLCIGRASSRQFRPDNTHLRSIRLKSKFSRTAWIGTNNIPAASSWLIGGF